jgi:hypothetical protein
VADQLCAIEGITEDTPFTVIKEVVTGSLEYKLPIPSFLYHDLLTTTEKHLIEPNFRILQQSECCMNKFWPIINMINSFPCKINETNKLHNVSIFDFRITMTLEFALPDSISERNFSYDLDLTTSSDESSNDSIIRSILTSRPDFTLMIRDFLALVGVEKAGPSQRNEALLQLSEMLSATNSINTLLTATAPYLFAYITYASHVELFCYNRVKEIMLIALFNLDVPGDSMRLFINMINVARVMKAYSRKAFFSPYNWLDRVSLFKVLERRRGVTVTPFFYGVFKRYAPNMSKFTFEDAERIHQIYSHMMQNRKLYEGAIQCIYISTPVSIDLPFELAFSPLCLKVKNRLSDVAEILKALKSVLTVLVNLHKHNFVHGDVRWSNVMYALDEDKYLLID